MSAIAGISALARTQAATTNAPIVANSTGAASATSGNAELGRDAFLQLLVAQLRYQDPSKPADAAALITQSSQLAVVDKLETISKALDTSNTAAQVSLAASLIGRTVAYAGGDGLPVAATVTSVRFDGTDTIVHAGGKDIPLNQILGVGQASTAAPSTSGTTGASSSSSSTSSNQSTPAA